MSRELVFYPAVWESGKLKPFATTINNQPLEILWRNARGREDLLNRFHRIDEDIFSDEFKKYFQIEDDDYGRFYLLYQNDIERVSGSGLVKGYALIPDAHLFYTGEIWAEDLTLIPPEMFAEMHEQERKKYVQVAYVDMDSVEYIYSQLEDFSQIYCNSEIVYIILFSF